MRVLALFAAILTASVSAQDSLYLDVGDPAQPSPSASYAGAGATTGIWNAVGDPFDTYPSIQTALVDARTGSVLPGVTSLVTSGANKTFDHASTAADDERLLDDLLDVGSGGSELKLDGLAPGTYVVYVYAWSPDDSAARTTVFVSGSSQPFKTCGGAWPGGQQNNVTYTRHPNVTLAAGEQLVVNVQAQIGDASLNGVQVLPQGGPRIGASYCTPAVANSTGSPASIAAFGSDVAGGNLLRLEAVQLPPNQFGYFLTAQTAGFLPNAGGSQGHLCLSLPLGRFAAQLASSGAAGELEIAVDTDALPVNGTTTVLAGETWNFQTWYRDVGGASNFTDAVAIDFF